MTKVFYIALIFIICLFGVDYIKTIKQLSNCKQLLAQANEILAIQNKAILENSLQIEKFTKQKDKLEQRVIQKYKYIAVKDETCEQKLQSINEALKVFYEH